MNQVETSLKPKILVVPLDWGLGHATRCIPIIKGLLNQGCTVFLAGEGKTKILLQKEFPALNFLFLEGYRVRYAKNKRMLPFALAAQIPKILFSIKNEHRWLQTAVKKYAIDAVISDNRFGLYHTGLPSVFMTHQLSIKTGLGRMADQWLQRFNYQYINRFSECWVPDAAGKNNLGGELSHPERFPATTVKYLGHLSRFKGSSEQASTHILVLLSGPEPQRTILENLLLPQLESLETDVVLVRGLPGQAEEIKASANVVVYNHLPAEELQQKILQASLVISRCGYSTVMDLAALQKKSILIPTPAQTEQEYLAKHVMEKKFALCLEQKEFNLAKALDLASVFDYRLSDFYDANHLAVVISGFVAHLKPKETGAVIPATYPENPQP